MSIRIVVALLIAAPAFAQQGPPSMEAARTALEKSPRHGEWASVDRPGGAPTKIWVMYPERSDKAAVIIVMHSVGELDDWTRAVADRLAADGYIAIAPELIDGSSSDLRSRLAQVRQYAMSIPAANRQTGLLVIDGADMPIASDSLLAPVLRIAASELRSGGAAREWTRVLDYFETTFRHNK